MMDVGTLVKKPCSQCDIFYLSALSLWNLNETKKIITTLVDRGYHIKCIDWNQFNDSSTLILIGSSSSRIKLFDSRNLEYVVEQFGEHSKMVNDVK